MRARSASLSGVAGAGVAGAGVAGAGVAGAGVAGAGVAGAGVAGQLRALPVADRIALGSTPPGDMAAGYSQPKPSRSRRAAAGPATPALASTRLATIGYEGCTIDAVVTRLRDAGVGLLIDVRAVAQSRKPGFSKRQLSAALDEVGIGYVHLQGLGTPKPGRDAVRAGHPERMEVIFREHMTSDRAQAELAQLKGLASESSVCLLCFERNHMTCHRRLVAEMTAEETGQAVVHLAVS